MRRSSWLFRALLLRRVCWFSGFLDFCELFSHCSLSADSYFFLPCVLFLFARDLRLLLCKTIFNFIFWGICLVANGGCIRVREVEMDPCLQGVVSCPRNLKRMTSVEAVVGYVTPFFSHNKLASFLLLLLPSLGVFVLWVRMNFALVCVIERNSFSSLVLRRI